MSQLSPEKYIQTRVRTLPIYKCLVNQSWKASQSAVVVVMRKHNNGNITAGLYNMDLYCLGIRTTKFYFNLREEELLEELESIIQPFEEITYSLAHNIVFAGHDFAMDYEIQPHRDFKITRFILEDDTEEIPLIEVPLGQYGKPHLIAVTASQRQEEFAKLMKHAGPGNFNYTFADEEDLDEYFLDSIPAGKLDCKNVQIIHDLDDEDKVSTRNPIEQIMINAELYTRKIPTDSLYVTEEENAEWKEKWVVEFSDLPSGATQEQFLEYDKAMDKILSLPRTGSKEGLEDKMIDAANEHAGNPILIASFYEKASIMGMNRLKMIAELHAEKLYAEYALVKLTLALGTFIEKLEKVDEEDDDEDDDNDPCDRFEDVYEAGSIKELLPGQPGYSQSEFVTFALIQMLFCVLEEDLPFAVKYYNMISNSGGERSGFLPFVWEEYTAYLSDLLDTDDEDDDNDEEKDDDEINASLN